MGNHHGGGPTPYAMPQGRDAFQRTLELKNCDLEVWQMICCPRKSPAAIYGDVL